MKDFISSLFYKLGYTIIPNWTLDNFQLVDLVKKILQYHKVNCVIDIGANKGQYGDFMRKQVDYHGRLISFEANEDVCINLKSFTSNDNLWDTYNIALGSRNETLPFNIMKKDTFSSFHSPTTEFTDKYSTDNETAQSIPVKVQRLDEFINQYLPSFENIYLKIDTQGHDLEVIKGCADVISKITAIQLEISSLRIYEDTPSMSQTLAFLQKIGFDVCGLFPISVDRWNRIIEYDGVFINRLKCNI